jgi:Domain of unknown function (DUF4259)
MGNWGTGPFDNDAALDFLGDLADGRADAVTDGLRTAMTDVLNEKDYLEGRQTDRAIAAACLIAARIDPSVPIDANGKKYLDQLTFIVDEPLRELAAGALTRALDATDNEWHVLWAEADALAEVEAALAPYRTALGTPI